MTQAASLQEVVELAAAALAHKPSGVSADDLAILQSSSMDISGEALPWGGGGCGESTPALLLCSSVLICRQQFDSPACTCRERAAPGAAAPAVRGGAAGL